MDFPQFKCLVFGYRLCLHFSISLWWLHSVFCTKLIFSLFRLFWLAEGWSLDILSIGFSMSEKIRWERQLSIYSACFVHVGPLFCQWLHFLWAQWHLGGPTFMAELVLTSDKSSLFSANLSMAIASRPWGLYYPF